MAGQIAQEILILLPILPSEKPVPGGTPQDIVHSRKREAENTFWQTRIFSRIVSWGREFKAVKAYVIQNTLEALGLVSYKPRGRAKLCARAKNTS